LWPANYIARNRTGASRKMVPRATTWLVERAVLHFCQFRE
jgi:hypothetical protein